MKQKPTRIAFSLTALLFVSPFFLSACASAPLASVRGSFDQGAVIEALQGGDCKTAWRLVWPPAKSSNVDARLLLADAIYAQGLTPQGMGDDALSQLRSAMAIYAEVVKTGNAHAAEMLGALLRADVFAEAGGAEHASCLERATDPSACVDAILAARIFPSFAQWVSEVDAMVGQGDGKEAKCTRMQGDQIMDDSDFEVRPQDAPHR